MGVIRGSSFYEVVSSVSWQAAESLANALGGNLAAINDENENIFILGEFASATQGSSRGGLWIGLSSFLPYGHIVRRPQIYCRYMVGSQISILDQQ